MSETEESVVRILESRCLAGGGGWGRINKEGKVVCIDLFSRTELIYDDHNLIFFLTNQ